MACNRETFTFTSLVGNLYFYHVVLNGRFRWPRGVSRWSTAARLLRLCVRILPEAWVFVVNVVCCQVEVSATS